MTKDTGKIRKIIEYEFRYDDGQGGIHLDHGNKKKADKMIINPEEDLIEILKLHRYGSEDDCEVHREEFEYWKKEGE